MGVKLTKIDELDDYRSKINGIGKYQVERMTVPWFDIQIVIQLYSSIDF